MDGVGSAYVTGFISSSDFPTTAGAFDTSHNGNGDAFVVNLTFPVVGTVAPSGGSLASSADRTTQSYTVTVQYTEAEKGPAIEDTLALYCWDGSQWVKELSSEVDTVNNTITATPNHFSSCAVLGEARRVFLPIILKSY